MKKTIIITIKMFILLLSTIVFSALDNFTTVNRTDTLEKDTRDTLLNSIDDNKIDIDITIKCDSKICVWSAVQGGLINTHDNSIPAYYEECIVLDGYDCITWQLTYYSNNELTNKVQDLIKARLERQAETLKEIENKDIKVTGNIIFNEEK